MLSGNMESKEVIFEDKKFYVQVLKLEKSAFVYVGDSSARLDNLAIAMESRFVIFI